MDRRSAWRGAIGIGIRPSARPHALVFGATSSRGAGDGTMIDDGASWSFGRTDILGPDVAVGHLWNLADGQTRDQIVLWEFGLNNSTGRV